MTMDSILCARHAGPGDDGASAEYFLVFGASTRLGEDSSWDGLQQLVQMPARHVPHIQQGSITAKDANREAVASAGAAAPARRH